MKTGCLITTDNSEDHLIKPEGLPEYQVPPPSLVEPVESTAVSNLNDVSPREIDFNESRNEINETAGNDKFLAPMRAMEKKICSISLITLSLNRSEVPYQKKLFSKEIFAKVIFAIQ